MKKFDGFQLKLFMLLIMVLDHIDYFIPSELALIFHVLTRCVGVWFGYMAVEGFIHTKNIKKYIIRLFTWAGIMFLGNTILMKLFKSKDILIHNNIFLTIACGVLILTLLSYTKGSKLQKKAMLCIGTLITLVFSAIYAEGAMTMIPFMLITYYLRNNRTWRNVGYLGFSILLFSISFVSYETIGTTLQMLAYNSDFMFITMLPFMYMYNGKRGLNTKFTKYLFYIFYPLHLWIIATIAYFFI